MKSVILGKGSSHTCMYGIFQAINNKQTNYNWLITNCEAYPRDRELEQLFSQEYIWISGEELTVIIDKEDFQFVWGVLSGFTKEIELEEVLRYDLPSADGNQAFWVDNVSVQHPLADVEIVAWDSSYTLFISKDDNLVEGFMNAFPLSKDLSALNIKQNAEVNHIQELLVKVLTDCKLPVDDDSLHKKYLIWNKLYHNRDVAVADEDILELIYNVFGIKKS